MNNSTAIYKFLPRLTMPESAEIIGMKCEGNEVYIYTKEPELLPKKTRCFRVEAANVVPPLPIKKIGKFEAHGWIFSLWEVEEHLQQYIAEVAKKSHSPAWELIKKLWTPRKGGRK